jgi:hypothetical protein
MLQKYPRLFFNINSHAVHSLKKMSIVNSVVIFECRPFTTKKLIVNGQHSKFTTKFTINIFSVQFFLCMEKTAKLFHLSTWSAGPRFVLQSCSTSHGASFVLARNFYASPLDGATCTIYAKYWVVLLWAEFERA